MNTTLTPLSSAFLTTGASAAGSVGASAMPSTPLVSASSIWAICAGTSDSVGGAITVTCTPSALPASSAPFSTAAQNGLPPPGPFMFTSILMSLGCLAAGAAGAVVAAGAEVGCGVAAGPPHDV